MAPRLDVRTSINAAPAPDRLAEITGIHQPDVRRVLNSLNIGVAAGLTLLPILVGAFSVLGGLGVGISISGKVPTAAAILVGGGIVCGVLSVLALVSYQRFLASRYLRWAARRVMSQRADLLVRPNDPTADFVDVIPRSHWDAAMLEPATDIGFFAIDHARRELRFEGDSRRYRIPFEAVEECHIEEYSLGHEQWKADVHYVTVLTVETATGPREVPLAGRHVKFERHRAAQRRAQAHEFCSRILMALNAHATTRVISAPGPS